MGRSVGEEKKAQKKKKKKKIWRSLELRGLVPQHIPQHNICGAWKRQDEVIKSTWRHWGKEKLNSNVNSEKKDDKTLTVLQIKVTMFFKLFVITFFILRGFFFLKT